MLLGGLLIHGLFPGPDLFTVHAEVTYTFIATLVLAQIAMCIFGLILSRYSYNVMRVPNLEMAAAVTILAVFGTYSVQNSFDDVIVMFALGSLMYVGRKVGFSPAPVVLGIILLIVVAYKPTGLLGFLVSQRERIGTFGVADGGQRGKTSAGAQDKERGGDGAA